MYDMTVWQEAVPDSLYKERLEAVQGGKKTGEYPVENQNAGTNIIDRRSVKWESFIKKIIILKMS